MVATIVAGMLLAGCGTPQQQEPTASPAGSSSSGWGDQTAKPPTTSTVLDFSDAADERFLAELQDRGVPFADPDDMILAGYGVCNILNDPDSDADMISVSAWVADTYEVSGDVAGKVAFAAVDVYCPTLKP